MGSTVLRSGDIIYYYPGEGYFIWENGANVVLEEPDPQKISDSEAQKLLHDSITGLVPPAFAAKHIDILNSDLSSQALETALDGRQRMSVNALRVEYVKQVEEMRKRIVETPPENRRLAKQAALLLSMPSISPINAVQPYSDPIRIISNVHHAPVNFFKYIKEQEKLYDIRPEHLSELVPYVRLFKIVRNGPSLKEVEFEFDATISDTTKSPRSPIEEILSGNARTGVGLKSVDWMFDGSDPFSASRSIQTKVTLFFQSFKELNEPRRSDNGDYRYLDLLLPTGSPEEVKDEKFKPELTEIKLVAGWSNPGENSFAAEYGDILDRTKTTIFLTLQDHEFNIRDDGTFDLTITYRGRLAGVLQDPRANIYYDNSLTVGRGNQNEPIFSIIEQIDECLKDKELEEDTVKRLRKTKSLYIENVKKHLISSIIKELQKNDQIHLLTVGGDEYFQILKSIEDSTYFLRDTKISLNIIDENLVLGSGEKQLDEDILDKILEQKDASNIESVLQSIVDLFTGGEEKDLANVLTGSKLDIQFFYLGDLIEIITNRIFSEENKLAWRSEAYQNSLERIKVLLGSFEFKIDEEEFLINIADIPISLEYFMNWLQDRVLETSSHNYNYLKFIQDVSRDLITGVLGKDFLDGVLSQDLTPAKTFFSLPSLPGGGDPLDELKQKTFESNVVDIPENARDLGTSDTTDLDMPPMSELTELDLKRTRVTSIFENKNEDEPVNKGESRQGPYYHYMFIYFDKRKPDFDAVKNLIPTFHLGRDRGLLKTASFSKTDIEFLREQRVFSQMQENYDPMFQLTNRYSLEMKMVGNNLFLPGSYVNFDIQGLHIDDKMAGIMGLGGYHLVTKVSSYIEAGKYETTVSALWDSPSTKGAADARGDEAGEIKKKPDAADDDCKRELLDKLLELSRPIEIAPEAKQTAAEAGFESSSGVGGR